MQVFPIALIAGVIYGVIKYRNERSTPFWRKALSALFVCYVTGLICLVCLFDVIGDLWYRLLYHMDSGRIIRFFDFSWDANFVPDFFTHMDGEMIANVILFLPFGLLYPFFKDGASWRRTVLAGIVCSVIIEIAQPVFGRAFDINDIILNTVGVLISATVFSFVKGIIEKRKLDFFVFNYSSMKMLEN